MNQPPTPFAPMPSGPPGPPGPPGQSNVVVVQEVPQKEGKYGDLKKTVPFFPLLSHIFHPLFSPFFFHRWLIRRLEVSASVLVRFKCFPVSSDLTTVDRSRYWQRSYQRYLLMSIYLPVVYTKVHSRSCFCVLWLMPHKSRFLFLFQVHLYSKWDLTISFLLSFPSYFPTEIETKN